MSVVSAFGFGLKNPVNLEGFGVAILLMLGSWFSSFPCFHPLLSLSLHKPKNPSKFDSITSGVSDLPLLLVALVLDKVRS
jgi:hypothetical protein